MLSLNSSIYVYLYFYQTCMLKQSDSLDMYTCLVNKADSNSDAK